jgi:hypothetical protein
MISDFQKYILSRGRSRNISIRIPPHLEGRFAIVTNVRRDAVDTDGAKDESAVSAFAKASADWH